MTTTICLSDAQLHALLADDVPHGDLTTDLLGIGAVAARIEFRLRTDGTVAGVEEATRLFELVGASVTERLPSGSRLAADASFLHAAGSAAQLHRAWKVAQTLVEYASGVASSAAAIVAAARVGGRDVPVACTRKTIPGTKALAIKAIRAGGAWPHRLGLSDTLLVFPEHLAFIDAAQRRDALRRLRERSPERMLVVEAATVDEAIALALAGVDVVQTEKFSPADVTAVRAALKEADMATKIAVAGGINASNAAAYAAAGADVIVTSAPYYAPPIDVTVRLGPA